GSFRACRRYKRKRRMGAACALPSHFGFAGSRDGVSGRRASVGARALESAFARPESSTADSGKAFSGQGAPGDRTVRDAEEATGGKPECLVPKAAQHCSRLEAVFV